MSGQAILRRVARAPAALACLAGAGWLCVCGAALAQSPADAPDEKPKTATPRIVDVQAGFAGSFKVGYWTPLVVEVEAGDEPLTAQVEIVAPDGDGVPSRVHAPASGTVTIAPGERQRVPIYFKFGRLASEVTIGLRSEDRLAAVRRFSTQADGPLAGILASNETLTVAVGAGDETSEGIAAWGRGAGHVARLGAIEQLPGDWWGYEGVDAVVLTTSDDAISSQLATGSRPLSALKLWVRMGGRLILSVGRQAEKVLAAGSPLAELAPGTFGSIVPLRQSSPFETYIDTTEPLASAGRFTLQAPKLDDVQGRIEAFSGSSQRDLPLVVRRPYGFGEIVFVAADLDQPPFATWAARGRLIDRLLESSGTQGDDGGSGTLGAVTTLGFVDLAGQLRGALDQFAGVELVPFWLVALLVTIYIACIGPLDYFLVKRVFRRHEATWISFGVTVVLFCAGAVALANGLKSRQVLVNQVDLVDVDSESGLVRGTSWSFVYSPVNDTYDLALEPQTAAGAAPDGLLFSWFGLPGAGFGGMDVRPNRLGGVDSTSQGLALFTEPYDFAGRLNALERVPVAVWSSKAFVGRWWRETTPDAGVEAKLADNGRLVGTLTSHLDVPLTGAVLIYGKWAYVIRNLEPERTVDFEDVDPQTANTYLRHVMVQNDRQVARTYDRAAFDVPRIVEIMTAHELVEGKTYTGLTNQYQGFAELSRLVQNGRAVLFGIRSRPAARLTREGEPLPEDQTTNWTFYRYVFPVAEQLAE